MILADIFVVQDEVVGKIVSALADALPATRSPPRRTGDNVSKPMICSFAGGRWHYNHHRQPERRDHFFKGLSRSIPTLRKHMRGLRSAIISDVCIVENRPRSTGRSRAQWRNRPCRSIRTMPMRISPLAICAPMRVTLAEGVAECEMGLHINPNHDGGWITLADLRVLEGRAVEGIECANNAFRLNPYPPGHYYWLLGFAQYAAGHYQDTVDTLSHPSASGPGTRRILAAALAQLGRMSEAQEEARKFLLEFPTFLGAAMGKHTTLPQRCRPTAFHRWLR